MPVRNKETENAEAEGIPKVEKTGGVPFFAVKVEIECAILL